eukprot:5776963-Pyramimonas_sp.AAC.1
MAHNPSHHVRPEMVLVEVLDACIISCDQMFLTLGPQLLRVLSARSDWALSEHLDMGFQRLATSLQSLPSFQTRPELIEQHQAPWQETVRFTPHCLHVRIILLRGQGWGRRAGHGDVGAGLG